MTAWCLALMGCAPEGKPSDSAVQSSTERYATYCFDNSGPAASRQVGGECQAPMRQITEAEFAAFAGSGIVPGTAELAKGDIFYCFGFSGPATTRRTEPCKWDQVRITEQDYAAYVGSGVFPYNSLLNPVEKEGFVYCLDVDDGTSVYAGLPDRCIGADKIIDRAEFVARYKKRRDG